MSQPTIEEMSKRLDRKYRRGKYMGHSEPHPANDRGQYDASGKVGRNDPCLCNSGKKSKRCCGAPAAKPPAMTSEQIIDAMRISRGQRPVNYSPGTSSEEE